MSQPVAVFCNTRGLIAAGHRRSRRPSCLAPSRLFASVPPCSVSKSVAATPGRNVSPLHDTHATRVQDASPNALWVPRSTWSSSRAAPRQDVRTNRSSLASLADDHLVSQSEIAARADSRPPTWAALMRRVTPIGKGLPIRSQPCSSRTNLLERRMVDRPHAQTAQREVCTTAPGRWRGARRWRR